MLDRECLNHVRLIFCVMQMQGGLIALHAAIQKQTLFAGIVLSAANVEVDPKVAGWFTVRTIIIKCNVSIVACFLFSF